jgi:hypothetical protein
MHSPHLLRDHARAQLAPWVAAMAVFIGIAAALLAGGAQGPLASAEANGDRGSAAGVSALEPEPVLGSEDLPPAGEPGPGEPPLEPEPAEEPPIEEPPVEEPPVGGEPDPAEPPAEQPNEPPVVEPDPGTIPPQEPGEVPPEESPVTPEPPMEEPTPPPAVSRPQPIDPNNAAGTPGGSAGTPGTSDPSTDEIADPGAGEPAGTPPLADAGPLPQGLLGDGAGSAMQRTVNFARATGLPLSAATAGAGGASGESTAGPEAAPAAGSGGFERVGANERGGDGGVRGAAPSEDGAPIVRTVRDIVEVVPDSLKVALGALAALSLLLGAGYFYSSLRARSLARQRLELLQEVGLLQTALLPPVPERLGALRTSVAYRPADGPGAGGDFYDALPLSGGRVGFILGDVSGHGRGALARTAFMRYTLRAYLEAGLEPRVALQVAGRVIDENLGGDFATVLLAVHDPETGSLTYATAGHPAPIVVGPQPHDPVTASSSPPIGVGERTGLRQTTVPLVPGSVACLFTDGLIEARTADGVLGRERLTELLEELGPDTTAKDLIARAANEARVSADDIAAVVISPTAGVTAGVFRTEQLELSARELDSPMARRFLESCGLPEHEVDAAEREARGLADRFGGVVLHVVFGNRRRVEVLPRNVESIEAASRRAAAR